MRRWRRYGRDRGTRSCRRCCRVPRPRAGESGRRRRQPGGRRLPAPREPRHAGDEVCARRQVSPAPSTLGTLTRPHDAGETKSISRRKGTVMQPGGQPDMSALLAQAQQMQQSLMAAQQRLINSEVHGKAGGGLVEVTVKGSGEVVAVKIDPKVVDPDDVDTLQDLIVGALGDASKQVSTLAQQQLGPLAGGMGSALGMPES